MRHKTPQVGCWYQDLEQRTIFEVVAVDDLEQTIETQMLDGAIEEFDFDSWQELIVEEVEEPEDWRNAYELSQEDNIDPGATIYPEDWNGPLANIESDIIHGVLDDL